MIKIMKKLVIIAALVLFQCLSPATQKTDCFSSESGPEALHQAANLLDEVRVRELINDYQLPIDQPDHRGRLPIHNAVDPNMENSNAMDPYERLIRQVAIISLLRSTLTRPTASNMNVMHLVARSGNVGLARILHQYNNQFIMARDGMGNTPLSYAAYFNQIPLMYYFIDVLHMPVNSIDDNGSTPLHYAIRSGARQAIIFLIRHNASIHIPTWEGQTPLDFAEIYDDENPMFNPADSLKSLIMREYIAHHSDTFSPAVLTIMGLGLHHMQTACSMLLFCVISHLLMTQPSSKL